MDLKWTRQDEEKALTQGWNVFEIWDQRVEFEIQKDDNSKMFLTDEAAREHVRMRAMESDPLCQKALMIAFNSKLGIIKTKRKK